MRETHAALRSTAAVACVGRQRAARADSVLGRAWTHTCVQHRPRRRAGPVAECAGAGPHDRCGAVRPHRCVSHLVAGEARAGGRCRVFGRALHSGAGSGRRRRGSAAGGGGC